jgi:hypothetical protein
MVSPTEINQLTEITERQYFLLRQKTIRALASNPCQETLDDLQAELEYGRYLIEEIDRLCQRL